MKSKEDTCTLSVDALFMAQVCLTPDEPAILDGPMIFTYRELDQASNRLARWIQNQGVQPGDLVALLTQRSAEAIITILAILKAGAAYLPLDPSYPQELLSFMVEDGQPVLMLGQRTLLTFLAPDAVNFKGPSFWDIDTALAASGNESNAAVDPTETLAHQDAAHIAYVMYTSGSTGRPKGVRVPHRAIARLVKSQNYAHFGPEETFLHMAPLAFDASTFEIWGALLHGGKLAIIRDSKPSLETIETTIARTKATTAWFTAGLFHLFVDHRLGALRPLRQILAGGDVLSPAHIQRALAGLPETQLINGYGPTENTTFTCCYQIPREGWGGAALPIGLPINQTDVYLLGTDLQLVPEGETGQLCTGGDGLALGYLNRPELTAEKFVQNPFSSNADDRLYLTGDLARRRSDGMIEFLGRTDGQVKINGKRVEIEEIENVLRSDARIADATVIVREDENTRIKRLIAYVKPVDLASLEPDAHEILDTDEILSVLRAKLPDYMIPSHVVVMAAFPLTPNGKIDRKQLPPLADRKSASSTSILARSKTELALAEIWSGILHISGIACDANFFDLGGTSLQLIAVHAEVQAKLRPDVPIVALFQYSKINELAAYLDNKNSLKEANIATQNRAGKQNEALSRMRQKLARGAR